MKLNLKSQVSSNVFEFDDIPASYFFKPLFRKTRRKENQGSTTGENGQRILSEELKAKREQILPGEIFAQSQQQTLDNPKIP
ncbi:MAG: hypothetical protein IPF52_11540 [Saprospiraceae bacterium]|nr:hypothetical protein [Saprospiraceae bacterium]